MKSKVIILFSCVMGLLAFPGTGAWAQRAKDGPKKVDFRVMVSAKPDNAKGSFASIPLQDAQIRLTLSNGEHFSLATSNDDLAVFKGLPDGCEYVAEISAKGYVTAIYHGNILESPVLSAEFYTLKNPAGPAEEPAPFLDAGRADVEGFVTCPASFPLVSVPLVEATVIYTSAADSVCTTTDSHGYFRFDGIKDKTGKVCVSRESYKSVEAAFPPKDGSRWLWLRTEQDR